MAKSKAKKGTKKMCKTPVNKMLKGGKKIKTTKKVKVVKTKPKGKPPVKPVAMAPKGAMPPMKGGMPIKVM